MLNESLKAQVLAALEKRMSATSHLMPLVPSLMLVTRCSRVAGTKQRTGYEVIEFWANGWQAKHLIRSEWLSGMGIARRDHPAFAVFEAGTYSPTTAENFAGLLCEWLLGARGIRNLPAMVDIFFAICDEEHVSLGLAEVGDYTRPHGL